MPGTRLRYYASPVYPPSSRFGVRCYYRSSGGCRRVFVCVLFTTSAVDRRPDPTACAAQIRTAFFTRPRLSRLTIGTRNGRRVPFTLVYVSFYVYFCRLFPLRFESIAEFFRPNVSDPEERVDPAVVDGSPRKSIRDEEKIYRTRLIRKKNPTIVRIYTAVTTST